MSVVNSRRDGTWIFSGTPIFPMNVSTMCLPDHRKFLSVCLYRESIRVEGVLSSCPENACPARQEICSTCS